MNTPDWPDLMEEMEYSDPLEGKIWLLGVVKEEGTIWKLEARPGGGLMNRCAMVAPEKKCVVEATSGDGVRN